MKRAVCAVLSVFFLIAPLNVSASGVPDAPPTGTEAVYCVAVFIIADLTDGAAPDFEVVFTDISLGGTYSFAFSPKNGFIRNEIYQILANTTYEITVSGLGDKYVLTDKFGQTLEKTAATPKGLTLEWVVKEKDAQINYAVTRNAHGDAVYAEFIEALKPLDILFRGPLPWKDDKIWNVYNWDKRIKDSVADYGACSEEYFVYLTNDCTKLEQYCWWMFYGQFVDAIHWTYPIDAFGSEESVKIFNEIHYNSGLQGALQTLNTLDDYKDLRPVEVYENIHKACENVILWQYHFFLENADFYDFSTGQATCPLGVR